MLYLPPATSLKLQGLQEREEYRVVKRGTEGEQEQNGKGNKKLGEERLDM